MSNINNSLIGGLLLQLDIISTHQELAENNRPNQLPEMIDALTGYIEAIGSANALGIASVNEDAINVLTTRFQLKNSSVDESFTETQ